MKDTDNIHLRSDEVQEILSRPPHALIRYGIMVISMIVIAAFVMSFFYSYPDRISGTVSIKAKDQQTENNVSSSQTELTGRMLIPAAGMGKVKPGQLVIIKVDEYPYLEFGMLKAEVVRISSIPNQKYYAVDVAIGNELQTTTGKQLQLLDELNGHGEIITDKSSLMERTLAPVLKLLKKEDDKRD